MCIRDRYWVWDQMANPDLNVYKFVLDGCRENLRVANQFGKDHNVWLQTLSLIHI